MRKILMALPFIIITYYSSAQKKDISIPDSSKNNLNLQDVTISATRFKENKKYIAQQVVILSQKNIEQYNQPTSAELLTQTGQVLVQKSQLGGGSPIIRGFEANKVLIVVDGIRMNNAIYRGGHLQNVITIDNEALEKTEILMGPSSVMYGSDALGGVMSFYTKEVKLSEKKGKIIKSGKAAFRYASAYDEWHGHADMNFGSDKIGSFTSISISKFGNLRQGRKKYADFPNWGLVPFYSTTLNGVDVMASNPNTDVQTPTAYNQYDLVQKIKILSGRMIHNFNFQYSTSSNVPRYDRLSEINSLGIFNNAQWYYGPQSRFLAAWNTQLPSSNWYDQSNISLAYQVIEESRHNRNFDSTLLKNRTEKVKVGSLNADFFKKIKHSEFTYGIEIISNKVNSSAFGKNISTGSISKLDTRYPDGGSHTESYALYIALLQKLSAKWIIQAGSRLSNNQLFSKFNDTTFFSFPFKNIKQNNTAVTGNLGIVFLPGKEWKLSLLTSSGYRSPNVDDLTKVFESAPGKLIVPNPNLKPERTYNIEFSIGKKIKDYMMVSTTLWYTDYNNIFTTDASTINGQSNIIYDGSPSDVFTTVNKMNAHLLGANIQIAGDINQHFTYNTTLNYTYGRIQEIPNDYPLDHIPPIFGKTSLTYKTKKNFLEVFALFNGKKDSSNYNLRGEDNQLYSADPIRGYSPSWLTLNIRNSLTINNNLVVELAIENIFDKFYRVFASGLSAPGRNIVLTIRGKL